MRAPSAPEKAIALTAINNGPGGGRSLLGTPGIAPMPTAPHALVIERPRQPLVVRAGIPADPAPDELRLRVEACGVCRTDLHVLDGELPQARYPVVPGHEIVGIVEAVGASVDAFAPGDRVGVPWLASSCGRCRYCLEGRENLCDAVEFTGCTRDGGYATHALARAAFCIPIDARWPDPVAAAPLLCAGLIGWRALRIAGAGERLGLYGFGAAAHIVLQLARAEGRDVYAFTRAGDDVTQAFAASLGARWAGDSGAPSPVPLEAAIIFAPVGALVPVALAAVRKGGRVVCAGIHVSDIPSFPYRLLWEERELVSVANLTCEDGRSFFPAAAAAGVRTHTRTFALDDANQALHALRAGGIEGAAVLVP